jgi:hypothetical protein
MVCFESHQIAGLGLTPSKILVAIMNFLGCELVHLNLECHHCTHLLCNAI